MQRLSDSLFVLGADTLRMNPWLQGGNRFGTIGKFGTLDDNPIDFYTNDILRGRWSSKGNLIIGRAMDNDSGRLQVYGSSYFNCTQEITGGWADSSGTHTNYHPVVTNIGPDIETSCKDTVTM
jgi:hypothetical protein